MLKPSQFKGTKEEIIEEPRKIRDQIRSKILQWMNEYNSMEKTPRGIGPGYPPRPALSSQWFSRVFPGQKGGRFSPRSARAGHPKPVILPERDRAW